MTNLGHIKIKLKDNDFIVNFIEKASLEGWACAINQYKSKIYTYARGEFVDVIEEEEKFKEFLKQFEES